MSSDDSNTNAKAIRLLNTYSKIVAVHYSPSESAVYVTAAAYGNNIGAHILSNVNGEYVPTVAIASALPSDAVQVTIVELGPTGSATNLGNTALALTMKGKDARPTYNGESVALSDDVPDSTRSFKFTYEDGTTETIEVYVK